MNYMSICGFKIISNAPVTRDSQNRTTQEYTTFEISKVNKYILNVIPEFSSQQKECYGNDGLK
jgi:hypothetical protein